MGAVRMMRTSSLSMRTFRPIGILGSEFEQRRLVVELYLLPGLIHMHNLVDDLEQGGFAVDIDVVGFAGLAPAAIDELFAGSDARHSRLGGVVHNAGEHADGCVGV